MASSSRRRGPDNGDFDQTVISKPPVAVQNEPPRPSRYSPYLVTFTLAALVAAVAAAFFVIGIIDGSVSSLNITLGLGLLAVVGVILLAGVHLRSKPGDISKTPTPML